MPTESEEKQKSEKPKSEKPKSELLSSEFLKRLEQLQITSTRIFQGRQQGERRSKRRGVSIEFADYRDYVRGDDTRFIDWNLYSRLDRYFLKLFMEEQDLYFYSIIDTSKSMEYGNPAKLLYAKQVAAALSYIGLTKQDKVGISAFASNIHETFRPTRGRAQIWRMLEFLGNLKADGQTSLAQTCRNFVLKNRMRGIVVLISDFFDEEGFEGALKFFLQGNYEIFVVQILDKEEMNPEIRGHMELVDSETEDKTEITITPQLLQQYKRTLEAYCTQINTYCTQYGMNYLVTSTEVPFDEIILKYMRRRGLLR